MYLFHAIADESVPHENSIVAYDSFIENGAEDVYFELLPESFGGHQDAAVWCLMVAFNISEELKIINDKGDLNNDGIIDILDLVQIVSVVMDNQDISSYIFWSSDLNSDLIINVLDVVATVNIILNR
jgi:hypothetical protein